MVAVLLWLLASLSLDLETGVDAQLVGPGAVTSYSSGGGSGRRGFAYVHNHAAGFFMAGSTIEGVNGIYARVHNLPPDCRHTLAEDAIVYHNEYTDWYLAFVNAPKDGRYRTILDKKNEWVLIDKLRRDRFGHQGNTYTLGSGRAWSHLHRPSSPQRGESGGTVVNTFKDDEDELPWQVIYIGGIDYVRRLQAMYRWNEEKKRNALLGMVFDEDSQSMKHLSKLPSSSLERVAFRPPQKVYDILAESKFEEEAEAAMLEERFDDAANLYGEYLSKYLNLDIDGKYSTWVEVVLRARKAKCHRRSRQFQLAIDEITQLLGKFPQYTQGLVEMAAVHIDMGKPILALETLETIYQIDREFPNLDSWLVRACADKERENIIEASERFSNLQDALPAKMDNEPRPQDLSIRINHYLVLEVTHDASYGELKRSYRRQSKIHHPDQANGSSINFECVHKAFSVLSDEATRSYYDSGGDITDLIKTADDNTKETFKQKVERKYFPERFPFHPFGDPWESKRNAENYAKNSRKPEPNAADIPDGTYKDSCQGCSISESILKCTHCKTGQGARTAETSINVHECGGDDTIGNMNGRLNCEAKLVHADDVPLGEYLKRCEGCHLVLKNDDDPGLLVCKRCTGRYNHYFEGSLRLDECLRNPDGEPKHIFVSRTALMCELSTSQKKNDVGQTVARSQNIPEGSYKGSCKGCVLSEDILFCSQCKTGLRHRTTASSININECDFHDTIANVRGKLLCEPKIVNFEDVPPGSYLQGCGKCHRAVKEKDGSNTLICDNCKDNNGLSFSGSLALNDCLLNENSIPVNIYIDDSQLKCETEMTSSSSDTRKDEL